MTASPNNVCVSVWLVCEGNLIIVVWAREGRVRIRAPLFVNVCNVWMGAAWELVTWCHTESEQTGSSAGQRSTWGLQLDARHCRGWDGKKKITRLSPIYTYEISLFSRVGGLRGRRHEVWLDLISFNVNVCRCKCFFMWFTVNTKTHPLCWLISCFIHSKCLQIFLSYSRLVTPEIQEGWGLFFLWKRSTFYSSPNWLFLFSL